MTNINLLRVSTPECHPPGVYQIKAIQAKLVVINIIIHIKKKNKLISVSIANAGMIEILEILKF
jgi:hypothetical protein